jgi:predicted metalloendopeptidase
MNSLMYLPSPYSDMHYDFFGKSLMGQEAKLPKEDVLVRTVHNYMTDDFSQAFWEKAGDPQLVDEICDFTNTLIESAKRRIETADWLLYKTRLMAVKKIDKMLIQTVRPEEWSPVPKVTLDPKNFLKNVHTLGERAIQTMLGRIGEKHDYWEEGIYRVNAYYFSQINKIMIPYGSCISPFYSKIEGTAWNYGALGSVIGHEMCHGFDREGKEYDENGKRKNWWTRKDNLHYNKRTKSLIKLFNRQKIGRKHVDGRDTLSENIADLGGLGISLQALKDDLQKRDVVDPEDVKEEYRKFFIAFAVSWRTKARARKLERALLSDPHSPAYLRVNLVVSQFDEWYAAFGIGEGAKMFIKGDERIRIF